MSTDFTTVTEIAGDDVTSEQVERLCHRYYWAGLYCEGKDVVEVACGTGQGLGYLASKAKALHAGDIDKELLKSAKNHYQKRMNINIMDAQNLPFEDGSLDVIILFEALYYLPDPEKFIKECGRVLRDDGCILISVVNRDHKDFHPSPFSHTYHGVRELQGLADEHGFASEIYGYWGNEQIGLMHRVLAPVKNAIVACGLLPKTMDGKKLLKRLVYGKLVKMPPEVKEGMYPYTEVKVLPLEKCDQIHRFIYCVMRK